VQDEGTQIPEDVDLLQIPEDSLYVLKRTSALYHWHNTIIQNIINCYN